MRRLRLLVSDKYAQFTTGPSSWTEGCARPVMLQAMKEDLPLNTKCKDKFLIQSTVITTDKESMPLQDIVRRPCYLLHRVFNLRLFGVL